MAIYKTDFVDVELNSGNIHRTFMNRPIGEGDKLANRFGVRILRNGEEVQLSGVVCSGYFIRSSGDTVILSGTVSGNTAYVELTQACYAVEGQFSLAIKLSGGDATGTMRIVDGVVANTTTTTIVDPGTIMPSSETLLASIEEAVASIPADYSDLWESIAPNFSTSAAYAIGQYVTYDGGVYRFTSVHSAGSWDASHVVKISVGDDMYGLRNALNDTDSTLFRMERFNDWPTEIGTKTTSYPLGWRDGLWGNSGTRNGSSTYVMNAQKIRAYSDPGYSSLFYGVGKVNVVSLPSGCVLDVKAWKPSTNEMVERYQNVRAGGSFPITQGLLYGINMTGFQGESTSVIASEFVSQIVFVLCYDEIGLIKSILPIYNFNWSNFATDDAPKGWVIGSYVDNNGVPAYQQGLGNAMTLTRLLTKSDFANTPKITINFDGNYTFHFRKWANGEYTDKEITNGGICEIGRNDPEGTKYAFVLTGFGTAAQDYIDNGYTGTVVITKYEIGGGNSNHYYRGKVKEFERFTVKTNLAWPNHNSTAVKNEELITEANIKCVIALPDTYSVDGDPVPLIMFGHGASCHISDTTWYGSADTGSSSFLSMIRAFVNAGFAVFDVDNTRGAEGGFPDWGSLPLMTAYRNAWEYIKKNYNVEHKLYIVSDSMGTAANLNMMKWHPGDVVTSIMIAPRPLCKHRYATQPDQRKKEMLVSFGIEPDSILDDSTFVIPDDSVFDDPIFDGFEHYENIITISGKKYLPYHFPPVKVIVGQADTDFLNEVREYYTAMSNSGNFVDYREVAGAAHNISFLTNYTGLTTEAINWLKRFRFLESEDVPS